ncbi:restriction endonuclease subunit S [Arthrobacter rhizosphaerae]|uniref:restriction endonuclease subunit S n=1 Tax=Arthrobacter rhizosphaerae TaxID=2855490 RepID=UPI001FF33852|nr:restriction endonuclease subunit S [Arthrobacter rhizosphaerae]
MPSLQSYLESRPRYGIGASAVPWSAELPAYIRITDIDQYGRFRPDPAVSVADPKAINYSLLDGDLVVARTGASVGKSYRYRPVDGDLVFAGFLMAVRPDPDVLDPDYLSCIFQSKNYWNWIAAESMRSGQPGVNAQQLAQLEINPPRIEEQRAIAEAIRRVDDLLDALERLIAKKCDVKRGVMQQLLTGRTRLPGFSGAWAILPVADYSHLKARIGWQGLTTGEYLTSGEYRLVGGTDFKSGHVDWGATAFVDKRRFDQDKNIQLQNGDVLITKDGTIGKVAIVDSMPGPSTLNSGVFILRPKRGAYDSEFIYWMLRSRVFEEFVAGLSAGSTITHLYQRDLVTLELLVPPTIEEQAAIAQLLRDADSEIRALERRLESARAVKVGMMQELLTGRTRLRVTEEA